MTLRNTFLHKNMGVQYTCPFLLNLKSCCSFQIQKADLCLGSCLLRLYPAGTYPQLLAEKFRHKKSPSSFFLTTEAFVSFLYPVIYALFHQHNHCIRIKFTKYPQYIPISSYHYWNRTYFSIKSSSCYSSTSFPSIYSWNLSGLLTTS